MDGLRTSWRDGERLAAVGASSAVLLLAWLTYSRAGWVPLLSGVDFGIHELGHMLFLWAPRPLMVFAGSALQVAVPLVLAVYFWRVKRDRPAGALMLAWVGSSLNNVSVYIYDATRLALPLWGDFDGTAANHDWRYLLGPQVLDVLEATDAIAYSVRAVSAALFAVALVITARVILGPAIERRRARRLAEYRATLPVREAARRRSGPSSPPSSTSPDRTTAPPGSATPG